MYLYYIWFPFTLPLRTDGIVPVQRFSQRINYNLKKIELKPDLARIWFEIIHTKAAGDFLEHLADYQEIQNLLSKDLIQTLNLIYSAVQRSEKETVKQIIDEALKKSDELRPFKNVLLKFAK
ncbi:Hypothetical_protein [Hexamita inflata]|uniref:Hypothetical_protein n=1 Tax=Hexamita inflata TaxID=28002 RepID=A0AA86NDY5_9EUKA|nr:Hypothetical protein HINF_LOCUS5682 [Hexamita inflata]